MCRGVWTCENWTHGAYGCLVQGGCSSEAAEEGIKFEWKLWTPKVGLVQESKSGLATDTPLNKT